jgi:hypothetical protein
MLSRSAKPAIGRRTDAAVKAAQATEVMQQPRIASPVLLVRPRNIISTITRMNASAHPA